jgi:hypothetical protein
MDDNNKKWRLGKIKSIRVSEELLEMLIREVTERHTNLSEYARYSMVMQMKYGNHPHPTENAA